MQNQNNRDQKNFGVNRDKGQPNQNRNSNYDQPNQKSTGGQRNISPDSKRSSPTDTDLNE